MDTQKRTRWEQTFLHATRCLDLIYIVYVYQISTNISYSIRVIERTSFPYKVHSMDITQKGSKGEQPFLQMDRDNNIPNKLFVFLFVLMLYVPVNMISVMSLCQEVSCVEPVLSVLLNDIKQCLQ